MSLVRALEPGDDGTMIRGNTPIRPPQGEGAVGLPLAGHSRAEQDVVDAAVSVLFGEVIRPGDGAGWGAVFQAFSASVEFGRAGVGQGIPSELDDGAESLENRP